MYVRLLIQRYVCQIRTLRDGDMGDDWTGGGGFEGFRRGPFRDHVSLGKKRERESGSGISTTLLR